jgi:hypothetical protein
VSLSSAGVETYDGPAMEENTRGYLVVTAYDLERLAASGVYLQNGDRITKIGTRTRNLFIANNPIGEIHGFGHFPGTSGSYAQINVASRDPAGVKQPTQQEPAA